MRFLRLQACDSQCSSMPFDQCKAPLFQNCELASRDALESTSIEHLDMRIRSGVCYISANQFKSTALVYIDARPGYHGYDVFATKYDCEHRAQYGKRQITSASAARAVVSERPNATGTEEHHDHS